MSMKMVGAYHMGLVGGGLQQRAEVRRMGAKMVGVQGEGDQVEPLTQGGGWREACPLVGVPQDVEASLLEEAQVVAEALRG